METMLSIGALRAPSDADQEELEAFMIDEVFPAVDLGPTRAGSITRLALLRKTDGASAEKYLWLVELETMTGGKLFENRVELAVKKLESAGIAVSFSSYVVAEAIPA